MLITGVYLKGFIIILQINKYGTYRHEIIYYFQRKLVFLLAAAATLASKYGKWNPLRLVMQLSPHGTQATKCVYQAKTPAHLQSLNHQRPGIVCYMHIIKHEFGPATQPITSGFTQEPYTPYIATTPLIYIQYWNQNGVEQMWCSPMEYIAMTIYLSTNNTRRNIQIIRDHDHMKHKTALSPYDLKHQMILTSCNKVDTQPTQ